MKALRSYRFKVYHHNFLVLADNVLNSLLKNKTINCTYLMCITCLPSQTTTISRGHFTLFFFFLTGTYKQKKLQNVKLCYIISFRFSIISSFKCNIFPTIITGNRKSQTRYTQKHPAPSGHSSDIHIIQKENLSTLLPRFYFTS